MGTVENVVPSERLDAVLACPPPWLPEAAQLHHPAWEKSSHAHVHSYLTMMLCFPAPSDVAGHFVLWDVAGSCEDARGRCNGWV